VKVSIITPCYNSEDFIEETIESILGQRGDFEIEYIIIDGGSTDHTLGIVKKYKDWIESRSFPIKCSKANITYISERDKGMYDALAKGFKLVTGDIIAYINSDDFYLPNAFSIATEIFQKYPDVDWLTGMQTSYNEKGQIIDSFLPFNYCKKFIRKGIHGTILPFIQQESTFWRRELLNHLDFGRLKKYKFAGDFYIWYTFSKTADLYITQGCFAGFRSHGRQISKERTEYLKEFNSIAEKKGFADVIVAYVLSVVTYFMSNKIKRKLNSRIIYYDGGQWIKGSGRI